MGWCERGNDGEGESDNGGAGGGALGYCRCGGAKLMVEAEKRGNMERGG